MSKNGKSNGSAVLVAESVTKTYGQNRALDNVSLSVHAGEFVALLGPNGAGKTTLFQLLTGLFVADSGRIQIVGHDIGRDTVAALAEMGIVFQAPTIDLELTVISNLRFHCRLHGMSNAMTEERVKIEMARLGIADKANAWARTLSGGNRRRVELARALLHNPKILLMDEPTVGLDPASRRALVDYVVQLRSETGLGILWATHLVDEAKAADRVVILHRGRVLRDGAPADLIAETGTDSLDEAFLALTADRGGGRPTAAAEMSARPPN
jgi:ABC-2 type transport system ATP-binding protein